MATYRKKLAARRYPDPLIRLLVRLRELELEGGFTRAEVALLVDPDDGPKLWDIDPDTGEKVVLRQRLSDQLSPRDGLKPPAVQLVQAFVDLYIKRTGAGENVVNREINRLYQAAVEHAEREVKRRREEAEAKGLRMPSWADVRQRDRQITELRQDLHRRVGELAQARDQHADEITELHAEITELRRQLIAQEAELDQVRASEHQQRQAAERYRKQALRTRAEADRLEARIAQLTNPPANPSDKQTSGRHRAATSATIVRQGAPADFPDPTTGLTRCPPPMPSEDKPMPSALFRPSALDLETTRFVEPLDSVLSPHSSEEPSGFKSWARPLRRERSGDHPARRDALIIAVATLVGGALLVAAAADRFFPRFAGPTALTVLGVIEIVLIAATGIYLNVRSTPTERIQPTSTPRSHRPPDMRPARMRRDDRAGSREACPGVLQSGAPSSRPQAARSKPDVARRRRHMRSAGMHKSS